MQGYNEQFYGKSWAATDLAAAIGVPISTLRRRIMLWVNQVKPQLSH